jgi:hypothetical protein
LPWRSSRIDRRCRNTHATPFRGSRPSTSMVMYTGRHTRFREWSRNLNSAMSARKFRA